MGDPKSIFTGGLPFPEERIPYKTTLYWALFFFILFDSSMVIFASSQGENLFLFTLVVFFASVVMLRAI